MDVVDLGGIFLDLGVGSCRRIVDFDLWTAFVLGGGGDSRDWDFGGCLLCPFSSGVVGAVGAVRVGVFGGGGIVGYQKKASSLGLRGGIQGV